MHKSPASGHSETLPGPCQTRWNGVVSAGRRKLRPATSSFLLILACILVLQTASIVAQDRQPPAESTAQSQSESPPSPPDSSFDLSDEVVRDVLSSFQRGFETHNLEKVLDVFAPQDMPDYAQFRDQMVAFFRLHESVKLRYRLLQVTSDKDLGFAIADIEMDEDPLDTLPTPQRRSTQMRFQLKREPKGWRIIGLRPSDFFTP